MYIRPSQHARSPADVIEVIDRNPFATVVTHAETGMVASHLPVLHEHGVLYAHMARANPHAAVIGTGESMVIFTGPHAYISPSWYPDRSAAPTWGYVAVHCYGTAILHDAAETELNIARLVERMERSQAEPWTFSDLVPGELHHLLANVLSFEIPLARVEAKFKLNQGDKPERIRTLIARLEEGGDAPLAEYIRRYNEQR